MRIDIQTRKPNEPVQEEARGADVEALAVNQVPALLGRPVSQGPQTEAELALKYMWQTSHMWLVGLYGQRRRRQGSVSCPSQHRLGGWPGSASDVGPWGPVLMFSSKMGSRGPRERCVGCRRDEVRDACGCGWWDPDRVGPWGSGVESWCRGEPGPGRAPVTPREFGRAEPGGACAKALCF